MTEHSPAHVDDDAEPACRNCGSGSVGQFCSQCGQRQAMSRLTIRAFGSFASSAFFSLDSPLWRTFVGMLLRPGVTTAEYADGRRARYTNPVQFCLVGSVLLLALEALLRRAELPEQAPVGFVAPAWYRDALWQVMVWVQPNLKWLLVVAMPGLALALRVCFWRGPRNVAEQLAFVYLVLGISLLVQALLMPVAMVWPAAGSVAGLVPIIWTTWASIRFNESTWIVGLLLAVPAQLAFWVGLDGLQHGAAICLALWRG